MGLAEPLRRRCLMLPEEEEGGLMEEWTHTAEPQCREWTVRTQWTDCGCRDSLLPHDAQELVLGEVTLVGAHPLTGSQA